MTEIRGGHFEGDTQYAPRAAEPPRARCLFCGEDVYVGAFWMGATGEIAVCRVCVTDGRLGMLIGDALAGAVQISHAILATERHAYRSRVMAVERRFSPAFPAGL